MIIWSRWGFIAFLFIGIGVGLGFGIRAIAGVTDSSDTVDWIFVGIGWAISGIALFFFDRYVVQRFLDKPRPMTVTRQLPQPYTHPDGRIQTHEQVQAVDPTTGQPIVVQPRSTLFFIPHRFWPFFLVGGGLLVAIVNAVLFVTGR